MAPPQVVAENFPQPAHNKNMRRNPGFRPGNQEIQRHTPTPLPVFERIFIAKLKLRHLK
jgi:hypothetical protein